VVIVMANRLGAIPLLIRGILSPLSIG